MVAVKEQPIWSDEVRQIEPDDPVQGGEGGIDNIPHQQLANRTAYLKQQVESVKGELKPDEQVSLAHLLQRIKDLEKKAPPLIPIGGLFETTKNYANGSELSRDIGYGTWEIFGEGRVTIGATHGAKVDGETLTYHTKNDVMKDVNGVVGLFVLGTTGGEFSHKLTIAEMPKHRHKVRDNVTRDNSGGEGVDLNGDASHEGYFNFVAEEGGDEPHNNVQPFIAIGRWIRTA
ncbi:hypothetical protein [Acinetobacter sp. c3-l95]|uniref:phage baseplate protein n=1 Tax=Acinetobacter sp. c3-l95 TaxID=3342804 RepID=UPI0035BB0D3D